MSYLNEHPGRDTAALLTTVLTATPKQRAKLFTDPTHEVGKRLPPKEYWPYSSDEDARARQQAELAQSVLLAIAQSVKDGELSSTVNTDSVYEDYFAPIVGVSQRGFNTTFALSIGVFLAGVGLIIAGVYIANNPTTGTNATIVGSIFGGAGAISALGSVFAMARSGIRDATSDHARLRVVLTGFATELGQLRALAEAKEDSPPTVQSIALINGEIRASMTNALKDLYSPRPNFPAAPSSSSPQTIADGPEVPGSG